MSTRANIHFRDGDKTAANIYRHGDGHPTGLGIDLHRFLNETANLKDKRWGDAEYLAAKYLVWQALRYAQADAAGSKPFHALNFLSVAPCLRDHGDIDYRYIVRCEGGGNRPQVFVQDVRCDGENAALGEITKGDDGTYWLGGKAVK